MEKLGTLFFAAVLPLLSSELSTPVSLQSACLECHTALHIPSEMIYRRYLLRYSSKEAVSQRILLYLKHPSTATSIMPPPFFGKFPLKKAVPLDDATLRRLVDAYIDRFDIDGKIVVIHEEER